MRVYAKYGIIGSSFGKSEKTQQTACCCHQLSVSRPRLKMLPELVRSAGVPCLSSAVKKKSNNHLGGIGVVFVTESQMILSGCRWKMHRRRLGEKIQQDKYMNILEKSQSCKTNLWFVWCCWEMPASIWRNKLRLLKTSPESKQCSQWLFSCFTWEETFQPSWGQKKTLCFAHCLQGVQ